MSARRACADAAKLDVMETATAVTISTEAKKQAHDLCLIMIIFTI